MAFTGQPTRFNQLVMIAVLVVITSAGCTATTPRWIEQSWTPIESTLPPTSVQSPEFKTSSRSDNGKPADSVAANIESPQTDGAISEPTEAKTASSRTYTASLIESQASTDSVAATNSNGRGLLVDPPFGNLTGLAEDDVSSASSDVIRGQDPGYNTAGRSGSYVPPNPGGVANVPPTQGGSYVPPANAAQPPQPYTTYSPQQQGEVAPVVPPGAQGYDYFDYAPLGGNLSQPNYADIDVMVRETQTGKMTFGAAYNSNSGLVGQIIIDERNFDILGFPKSLQEIKDGTAWRGRGQGFRMELVPGNEVQRYLVSFTEPYLFNSQVSFSASGYFFDRRYFDWDEQRIGGKLSLGYRLTPDLSFSAGLRMEEVNIHDPRVDTSPELNEAVGDNSLYLAQFSLINDTRDHPFMATSGSYLELSYNQGFGDYDYPRGDLDFRKYFLVTQRPDGSGRHTLSFGTKLGVSGSSTPIYENYFAGGFSTLRGFDFRGASPVQNGVRVGGRFQWLNTVEYTFPITADDMFKGVFFCDFGTVEQNVEINSDNFRVAPGFGFRVHMPVGGAGGAPLAFDFAFPVNHAATDDLQVFSFYMGVLR